MRYWLDSAEAEPAGNGSVAVRTLFGPDRGCSVFEQRLLSLGAGETSGELRDPDRDDVLYVIDGRGAIEIGGERHELGPGAGVFVARGTPWRVDAADAMQLLTVLVEEPLATSAGHTVIAAGERETATAGREFTLLSGPENGCESVTQFVGHIPAGRAPDHFHLYDEVGFILAGEGAFHVGDESAELRPGSCFHLPARLVHCLENHGPGEMHVLGVFRPAGSPAEAYYPDGTAAVVPA